MHVFTNGSAEYGLSDPLDEELLIGIEHKVPDEEPEREVAPVPEFITA